MEEMLTDWPETSVKTRFESATRPRRASLLYCSQLYVLQSRDKTSELGHANK